MYNYLLLSLLVLTWSLNPFIKKKILKDLRVVDFYCISVLTVAFFVLLYMFLYNFENTKKAIHTIYHSSRLKYFYIVTVVLSVVSGFIFHLLIQKNDASYIIPQLQPIVMIFLLLWGYFVFDEDIDKNRILGILAVAIGIWFIKK